MKRTLFFTLLLTSALHAGGNNDKLLAALERIAFAAKGSVGVAVSAMDGSPTISVNDGVRFPMQSVFKFHIALTVLREADRGRLDITKSVTIRRAELLPDTWSPMRDAHPSGDVTLPLLEVIRYTVAQSDNNGADFLLRLTGGPAAVQKLLRDLGIGKSAVEVNEEEMHRGWDVQFRNWSSPSAAVRLLRLFHTGKILSDSSTSLLRRIMTETVTGPKRLKGLLPPGTPVAHKTGSSGRGPDGTSVVNDIGIITLPDGRSVAMAVFITGSTASDDENERVIAELAKTVWDFYARER